SVLDYLFRELAISYIGRTDLAHVQPTDLQPDTVGKGVKEGEIEKTESDDEPMEAVKRYASAGYVRNSLVVFHNHTHGNGHSNGNGHGNGHSHAEMSASSSDDVSLSEVSITSTTLATATVSSGMVAVTNGHANGHQPIGIDPAVAAAVDAKFDKIREARL